MLKLKRFLWGLIKMGRKIIIFEGNDYSGKTTTIQGIKDQFDNQLTYLRFPSYDLTNSDVFSECIYTPSERTILRFIDALIDEIRMEILNADEDDDIIIDRCLLSSLIYQGVSHKIYDDIQNKYTKMFQDLGISGDDVYNIILCGRLSNDDKNEENKVKKFIDSDKSNDDKWLINLGRWYNKNNDNPYLKNIMTFKVNLNNIGTIRECIYHFIDLL